MPKLSLSVTDRTGALGGHGGILQAKVDAFIRAARAARQPAAAQATSTSRQIVANRRDARPAAPARAGRYSGLANAIAWKPIKNEDGVGLDLRQLNQKFPPWLVQEIGTGQRATQKVAGRPNPQGRPTKGASYVKTVKPQTGRRISPGLVFASRGGQYSPPGAAAGQQLYLRSMVKGAPVRFDRSTRRSEPGVVISREIEGKHFIRDGGEAGFREYRASVLAAARSQLRKRRTV